MSVDVCLRFCRKLNPVRGGVSPYFRCAAACFFSDTAGVLDTRRQKDDHRTDMPFAYAQVSKRTVGCLAEETAFEARPYMGHVQVDAQPCTKQKEERGQRVKEVFIRTLAAGVEEVEDH